MLLRFLCRLCFFFIIFGANYALSCSFFVWKLCLFYFLCANYALSSSVFWVCKLCPFPILYFAEAAKISQREATAGKSKFLSYRRTKYYFCNYYIFCFFVCLEQLASLSLLSNLNKIDGHSLKYLRYIQKSAQYDRK